MLTKNWKIIIGILIFLYLIDSACYAQPVTPLSPEPLPASAPVMPGPSITVTPKLPTTTVTTATPLPVPPVTTVTAETPVPVPPVTNVTTETPVPIPPITAVTTATPVPIPPVTSVTTQTPATALAPLTPVTPLPIGPLGQVIHINTNLHGWSGRTIWTLIIRDLDRNIVHPHVFEFTTDHWIVFTYGNHYQITASSLQIENYQGPYNTYKNCRIYNFCNLETGRIMRNRAMSIRITGNLSPNRNTYTCHVTTYPVKNFYIVDPVELDD